MTKLRFFFTWTISILKNTLFNVLYLLFLHICAKFVPIFFVFKGGGIISFKTNVNLLNRRLLQDGEFRLWLLVDGSRYDYCLSNFNDSDWFRESAHSGSESFFSGNCGGGCSSDCCICRQRVAKRRFRRNHRRNCISHWRNDRW